MTRFLPVRIFSIFVLTHGCRTVHLDSRASPYGVQIDIPGFEEDRTRCEKAARGLKWRFGTTLGTRAASCCAARDVPARGLTLKRSARPFSLIFVLFLPFSPSGPHFAPVYSFAHILLSGTPIDNPSSPTRSTSKHLPIVTILFSFKR